MVRVRIPQIASLETAIKIYYNKLELTNRDIGCLFPSISRSTIVKLKKNVLEYMEKNGISCYGTYSVNTKAAYHVWGIGIEELEERYHRLKILNM